MRRPLGTWLMVASDFPGIEGVMYTTWANRFDDLERFFRLVTDFKP